MDVLTFFIECPSNPRAYDELCNGRGLKRRTYKLVVVGGSIKSGSV
jgi:hypothetical protein